MKITIAGAGAMENRFGLMLHQTQVMKCSSSMDGKINNGCHSKKKRRTKGKYNGKEVVVEINRLLLQSMKLQKKRVTLIILFTKAMQLESMLTDLKPVIHDETRVLCLLNGIGHEEVIEQFVPKKISLWEHDVDC